ncbi:MAG: hypothetical protein GKR86_06830 [Ilumatobacter sp.]|nr:hypothetical protein [Ilumatobacter sp.]
MERSAAGSLRLRLLGAASAASLVAAACGGGDAGGGSAESWCDFVTESDVIDEIFDSLEADPADVESGLRLIEGFVDRLPSEAPAEIADDAKQLADGTQMIIDAFTEADFNLLDADLAFLEDADLEARVDAAEGNVDEFTQQTCGRSFGSGSDDGDGGSNGAPVEIDLRDGTVREQIVTELELSGLTTDEAQCIADNIDFTDPAVQSGDVGPMLAAFDTCGIGLERFAELGGD